VRIESHSYECLFPSSRRCDWQLLHIPGPGEKALRVKPEDDLQSTVGSLCTVDKVNESANCALGEYQSPTLQVVLYKDLKD
jgi:hypothetical protein